MRSCCYRTMAGGDVRGRVTDGSNSPIATGWSDRARAMALKAVPDWLRFCLQIWVALATANGQARERASDERRRKAERGGVGTPHSLGASVIVLGVSMNELSSIAWRSRALRLVGSVIRRLGAPSALSPAQCPVADAREVELRWNARSHHQANPGLALGCG